MASVKAPVGARWGWIATQIQLSFGVTPTQVTELLGSEDGRSKFTALLTRPDSPARVLVFYQPRDVRAGPDDVRPGQGPPVLFVTHGSDDRLRGKALYFLRAAPAGRAVDIDKTSDSDLLVGELTADVLGGLRAQLASVYEPALARRDEKDWGKAAPAEAEEFRACMASITADISEAIENLDVGAPLRVPDASWDLEVALRECIKPGRVNPELLRHLEGALTSLSNHRCSAIACGCRCRACFDIRYVLSHT